jgi:hypothetical protein
MTSYLYAPPSGVPGDITRTDESNVEPAMLITPFPLNYGVPMMFAAGGVSFAAAPTAAAFAGILARAVPGISQSNTNEQTNVFQPNQSEPQGLMVRGYVAVICTIGTPVRGNPVYMRVVAAGPALVGDLEATSDPGNNVALSATTIGNVTWASDGKDATSIAEVRLAQ